MKKWVLVLAVVLLSTTGVVQAVEDDLGITLDVTYVSKYLWRGYDLLDDVSAFQPSVNVDLYGSGFSVNYWASIPGSGGNSSVLGAGRTDATEYDYTIAYDTTLFESESYETAVTANYIYYDFPLQATKTADAQELGVGFSWPNICPFGTVPSYYVGKIWESRSNSALTGEYGGWIHIFGIGYDLTVPGFLPDTAEQVISLMADITYNDGFGSAAAKHDWSHATIGVSTGVQISQNLVFTPALYFQKSMEDTVNTSDEFWTSLSMTYTF